MTACEQTRVHAVMVDCFSDLSLCRIWCCMVLHHSKVMDWSLFVLICALCNVIFIIPICSHACIICILHCLSAIICSKLTTICSFICKLCHDSIYVAYILKEKMPFNCDLINTKISVYWHCQVIDNELENISISTKKPYWSSSTSTNI